MGADSDENMETDLYGASIKISLFYNLNFNFKKLEKLVINLSKMKNAFLLAFNHYDTPTIT